MAPITPALHELLFPEPDTDLLAAWCRHAADLPDERVRAGSAAWSAAVAFHAPSLATAVAALSTGVELPATIGVQ
jgi:hypothetical protein